MLGLFIGKVITSIALNNTKKQIDPTTLMFLGGLVAGPLPILWPLSTAVWMLFLTHLVSGIAWASWEVGLSLCFFKNIETSEKMETISVYNYIGVTTQVAGTCVGALLIQNIFSVNYTYLFIFAGLIRFLCVLPLRKNRLNLNLIK
jgi:MFS family permease